jgi:glutamine amidotransferase
MESVAVIDYGMGNLRSVTNALRHIGADVRIASEPADTVGAARLVLPGVGAFGDGMRHLSEGGWIDHLRQTVLEEGTPLLGICLGMQLLVDIGTEHGDHAGLGWIRGRADRLPAAPGLRIPHVGWNDVDVAGAGELFAGIEDPTFYFVHSYAVLPDEPGLDIGWSEHGARFAASVQREHLYGVQFHPEKSHKAGLRLLSNFLSAPC